MNTTGPEKKTVVSSLALSFSHFLLGLDGGLLVYALYLWFFVGSQLHGKPTEATWNAVFAGLTFPVLFSAGAMAMAWWHPIEAAKSWGACAALLVCAALLIAFCLFTWTLIAFSGYC